MLGGQEAESAGEVNAADPESTERFYSVRDDPHHPPRATPRAEEHRQVLPAVLGRDQPEEEVRPSGSNLQTTV